MPTNISGGSGGEKYFSLDIPFNRTSGLGAGGLKVVDEAHSSIGLVSHAHDSLGR